MEILWRRLWKERYQRWLLKGGIFRGLWAALTLRTMNGSVVMVVSRQAYICSWGPCICTCGPGLHRGGILCWGREFEGCSLAMLTTFVRLKLTIEQLGFPYLRWAEKELVNRIIAVLIGDYYHFYNIIYHNFFSHNTIRRVWGPVWSCPWQTSTSSTCSGAIPKSFTISP